MRDDERARQVALIRATYAGYRRSNAHERWSRANRGFRRLISDRDRTLLLLLSASLPGGTGRLLDVGCGDGNLLALASERLPDIDLAGVDVDGELLIQATEAVPSGIFVEGSADQLPFASESVDVVVASTLFSSLPTPDFEQAVAGETARVLKPGGWLVWYDLRISNPANRAVHGMTRGRIRSLFPGWTLHLESTSLLPPIARRLGRATPILYPVLEALPVLRSHLIGRMRKPSG